MQTQTDNFDWNEDTWTIVKTLIAKKLFLIQHQIGSFNDFIDRGLPNIIQQFNPIILNYDYVDNQLFYRLKQDNKLDKKVNLDILKTWKEFKCQEELLGVVDQILNIFEPKISMVVDLSKQLSKNPNEKEARMEKIKEFID